ncbi:MAG: LysM peptidoglycan-binding domain-containing protein [Candidatus Nealsonbacteria bacterium]|nr:LysM peptidoglycan-binding domain-containing protein [Candidatus Nealsonbacteria bacterium]
MDILPERAHELLGKTGEIGLKNLIWLKKKENSYWRNIKGSKRDPFLYLGIIGAFLFIITVSSFPSSASVSHFIADDFYPQQKDAFIIPGEKVKESPDLSLIQKNSLVAISSPMMMTPQVLGALIEAADYEWTQKEITEYVVGPGDNLSSIAEKFSISLNTVLWANDLQQSTLLQIGQKLVILPTSGVIHHVAKGDNLSAIAKSYQAKTEEIIAFNNLPPEGDIYIGDILIVPGGTMPPPAVYAPAAIPLASSYFIYPIASPYRITQGLHWYNAVDFSNGKCGDPIYATAAGTVLKVMLTSSTSKWAFNGAGNYLTILHPNGVVTYYGHIQTSLVNLEDYVSQGRVIALMGGAPGTPGAGNSTGCHVHFGVSGAKNPFAN